MPGSYAPIVQRFDVIVAGAGPAGSLTAYLLAREGVSVLLADRARFPRDKPCGGGVALRGARLLPFAIGPVVERSISAVEFRHPAVGSFVHGGRAPVILMTRRRHLDAFLAAQAVGAGAAFRDDARVRAVELDERGGPVVTFDGGARAGADVLIAADGANGTCGRTLGLGDGRIFAAALEANVAYEAIPAGCERHVAMLELGRVAGGYGWLFPKGDHANVGVIGWNSQGPELRARLRELCERAGIAGSALSELRGHRLPMRDATTQVAAGRVLAVGDAAGLVDPLSGDGMYEAFTSAHVAAACAARAARGERGRPLRLSRPARRGARAPHLAGLDRQGRARARACRGPARGACARDHQAVPAPRRDERRPARPERAAPRVARRRARRPAPARPGCPQLRARSAQRAYDPCHGRRRSNAALAASTSASP